MAGLFHGTDFEQPVTCEHCGRELATCQCPRNSAGGVVLPRHQHPRVRREKRRGKWCTVIAGIDGDGKALLKTLRTAFGTGGGLSDGAGGPEIILQGDHREAVVERLKQLGYPAKAAGG
jgi:translation initiation factor 1